MQTRCRMKDFPAVERDFSKLRVAIVHYWFVGRGGGERVVEALAEMFPQADLFSLVADRSTLAPALAGRKLTTSFLQKLPAATRVHRHLLLLQPLALEQFDLASFQPTRDPHRQISVRLAGKLRTALRRAAKQKEASVGEVIRAALEQLPEKPARRAKARGRS